MPDKLTVIGVALCWANESILVKIRLSVASPTILNMMRQLPVVALVVIAPVTLRERLATLY